MNSNRRKTVLLILLAVAILAAFYGVAVIHRGFSTVDQPSAAETIVARTVRDLGIPRTARNEANPLTAAPAVLAEARENFTDHCAGCHGKDGDGRSGIGQNLYPKAPDLQLPATQNLSDGEIHYIIQNGVRLTGMPALGNPHSGQDNTSAWKLVLFIRSIAGATPKETAEQSAAMASAHYVGSAACEKCHAEIYRSWRQTPMANVVRDPREHPEAIVPDLSTNNVSPKFTRDQVAFVYGSIWKQRYFTKIGDDYFPEPAQWDISNKKWLKYFVPNGGDWWAPFYPPDNMQRPTGPTCDGCHSVDYNIQNRQVAEWNVGCERCHGPGSAHVDHATHENILNPQRMDYVSASDTCIQCHSQGRPLNNPIEGKYYDWPVGYRVGLKLRDYWQLEDHKLGELSFTHFPDGTAHKNRMQGNDFVQSVMYRRGVTCSDCHDVHGTKNYAQLRKPASQICLDCHGPGSRNGPREATLAEHTHHKDGSAGSDCVACHMPKIQAEIPGVFVSAHTFAFIAPAMTDRYKIPNPCTSCHMDKTTAWAGDALRHWEDESPWRME
ncbi:MAG TPA: cytochrome c3 family protein [Candidatus Acidoferrales bacterium]|nr:cytochrome c3 family protein [Candidatus Acidoferrales bacterium]